MSQHTAYLERMSERLAQLQRNVDELGHGHDQKASELSASIEVQRQKLNEMRRAGAELSPEMVQSFGTAIDGLGARIGHEMQKAA
ncbi:MAG TPA: hypothetical protein PKA13_03250 [Geminicoccaceae bacterium]|mgnify:CR=1 FL=1|nr:hypothetical protein [Geminicoccus sp.]HMU48764.1 hypothetical protein [Geminicoccaceae bacterium]